MDSTTISTASSARRKTLFAVISIVLLNAVTFAIFFSGLTLYLTQNMNLTTARATQITGLFLALYYFLPLLGGIVTSKIITNKRFFILGMWVSIIGCVMLAYQCLPYIALGLVLIKSMASKVSLRMFITQLFKSDEKSSRRTAFYWNYIGSNAGIMIGYALAGLIGFENHHVNIFLFMAVVNVISLLFLFLLKEDFTENKFINSSVLKQIVQGFFIMVLTAVGIGFLFEKSLSFERPFIVLELGLLLLIYIFVYRKISSEDKIKLFQFLQYSFMAIIFWCIYMLTPIALILFIANNVQRTFLNFTIPAEWFANIDSIVILIIGPIIAYAISRYSVKRGQAIHSTHLFIIALLLVISGLVAMACGFFFDIHHGRMGATFIFLYLVATTLAEIFISPVGDSLVGELIPMQYRSLMTGVWTSNIGIGCLFSGYLASRFISPYLNHKQFLDAGASQLGHYVVYAIIFVAVVVFISRIKLRYWTHSVGHSQ